MIMMSRNSDGDLFLTIVHLDDLHIQHQGGLGRDDSECSSLTVGHLMVHHDHPPLTLAASVQPQLPARYDLPRSEDDSVLTLIHLDSTRSRSRDLGGNVAGREVLRVFQIGHCK